MESMRADRARAGKTRDPQEMTAGKPARPDRLRRANTLTGIALKVASVAIFVGMSTSIKLAGVLPVGEIVFFRSFFAVFPVLAVFAWRGELRVALATVHPFSHIARGMVGVSAMGLGFFALTRLPLPEAITLNYAQPLLVVVFSALFCSARRSASTAGARSSSG